MYDKVLTRMKKSFEQVMSRMGDPLDPNTLYGPLHTKASVGEYQETINEVKKLGGKIEFGGEVIYLKIS